MGSNEVFSRVFIDAQLADQGWKTQDTNSVRYEVVLGDGTRADYVLCDRHGRSLAVIEAKRFSVFEGGKNIQAGSENGSSYRILKVSAATSGVYRESESKPAPDGYNPPLSHVVRAGDMLFSCANTEDLVGATVIVGSTDGKTLLPGKLWRFVWAEPVEPAYMHALFQSSRVRRELGKISSGTSASMRNISQGKLFDLVLPVAPYTKQKEFGERAAAVHSIQSQQSAATAKAQAAFDALLAQAFSKQGKQ